MNSKKIWLSSPTIHDEELEFVHEAFNTNWIAPLGPNVDQFEQEMAQYLGIKHGAALISGTAAIHLAVKLAGVKRGDIVFCSDLTFSATVNPVSYEGGIQVLIDSERDTWNMDPVALKLAFDKYPNCKCVIVANLYGVPAKLEEIREICREHNAVLIEDAAESLSAKYKGQQTGTFGDYNIISFNGNKIITTSGGGMLLSNNSEAIAKARFWSTQSREPVAWYEHKEIGYNYRMSNVVAGIGRGQLLHLSDHKTLKTNLYRKYENAFSDIDEISMNPYLPDSEPNFWLSCIIIDCSKSTIKPQVIIEKLSEHNVESRPIWKPMHLQPIFKDRDYITASDSVSEYVFEQGLCLPSDIKMTEDDSDRVIDLIREVFKKVK